MSKPLVIGNDSFLLWFESNLYLLNEITHQEHFSYGIGNKYDLLKVKPHIPLNEHDLISPWEKILGISN